MEPGFIKLDLATPIAILTDGAITSFLYMVVSMSPAQEC